MKKIVTFFVLLILSWVLGFLLFQKNWEIKSCKSTIYLYLDEYNKISIENDKLRQELDGLKNPVIISDDVIEESIVEQEIKSEIFFQEQPKQHWWNYESNTTILNAYAKSNMQEVVFVEWMVWQLVIKLRQNLKSHIVLYAKTENIYCWGRLSVTPNENNEVIINFSWFRIGKINCILFDNKWNLPSKLSLGWYVASFDWNWIEKITVK